MLGKYVVRKPGYGIEYENSVANGDTGLNKQFLLMPNCFIIYSKIVLSFTQIFHNFASMLSSSSAEDCFIWERVTHLPR